MFAKKHFLVLFLAFPVFVLVQVVNINTATLKELETLTGIGPSKAQAIIDARPFSSIDDLLKAKGIGEKTLQKIKDQGLAYVDPSYKKEKEPIEQNSLPIKNIEADVSESIPERKADISTYIIASVMAVLSGITILALEKSIP